MKSKYSFFIKGIFLFFVGYFIFQISLSYQHERQAEQLVMQKEIMNVAEIVDMQKEIAIQQRIDEAVWNAEQRWKRAQSEQGEQNETEKVSILPELKELHGQNNDLIGWLAVAGMKINNPVMKCADDFYVTHNFEKKSDKYGTLFIKDFVDLETPDTNIIIYGHNMRDGSMFGELDNYRSKDFYATHRIINFDTLYKKQDYEIVSVFLSKVYRKDEDVFKYYQFSNANSEEEYNQFYEFIKENALYDTNVTAEYGDTFITLSTCAYHEENGRLVVVAKRIPDKLSEGN